MYIFETTLDIDTVPFRLCDTLKALYNMLNRALVCLVALAASVNVFSSRTVTSYGVQAQYLLGLGTSPSITGSAVEAHLSRFVGIGDITGYEHVDKLTVYL